jgi:hypothetical protein
VGDPQRISEARPVLLTQHNLRWHHFWDDAHAENCRSCPEGPAAVLVLGAHSRIGAILHAVVVCRIVVE